MNLSPGDLVGPLYVLGVLPKKRGKSAYELWLDQGNTGDIEDFLESLEGLSAYEIWIALGNTGTEADFIEYLKGERGADGKSAYEHWLDEGNVGTVQDFLDSLKGEQGNTGPAGKEYKQDNFIINLQNITDKKITLSTLPLDPSKVSLTIKGGIEQWANVDFVVSGLELSWNGLALELLLEVNDYVIVRYTVL